MLKERDPHPPGPEPQDRSHRATYPPKLEDIGDLDVFRTIDPEPIDIKPNDPFDSELAVYSLRQFPEEFKLYFWRTKNKKWLEGDEHGR